MPTGGGTRPVQVAWGRGSGTQSTKGHSHVWAKGSASEGQPRLQRSAFGGSDAQAHTILLRPRAHTGLPRTSGHLGREKEKERERKKKEQEYSLQTDMGLTLGVPLRLRKPWPHPCGPPQDTCISI